LEIDIIQQEEEKEKTDVMWCEQQETKKKHDSTVREKGSEKDIREITDDIITVKSQKYLLQMYIEY